MILVICAAGAELGSFHAPGVDVVAVGVGPIEAAIGTARALAAKPYGLAVNAGIGGAFRGRARVGDAIAVTVECYAELGREDGSPLALPDGVQLESTCAADATWLERLRTEGTGLGFGAGITSATITTSDERAAALGARYAAACESMEGFAFLRAAASARVPALELRGISNIVGDRSRSGWDFRAGSAAALRALHGLLEIVERGA